SHDRMQHVPPPVVFEARHPTGDCVSVHDVVRSCILAMNTDGADYHAVNVGTGRAVSILHVAQVLLALYGSDLRPSIEHRFRAGDVRHCFADISLARRLLSYEPKVSFDGGMRELVDWGRTGEAQDGFANAYS